MGMRATLIELDTLVPAGAWYAPYRGRRLWCQAARELMGQEGWLVLPGQGVSGCDVHECIALEHAWQVREGEVELSLVEVTAAARQGALGLEAPRA